MIKGQPSDKDIFEKIEITFDALNRERLSGLERLKTIHAVRHEAAVRENERLKKKYSADHPRVRKISDRIVYDMGAAKELDSEIERAGIKPPSFEVDSWMVHGRILSKEGKGVKGYTVSLYDEKGNWIKELEHGCTDERGYFALKYKLKSDRDSPITQNKLILTVTDTDQKIRHREKEPLFIKSGQIDFRIILLDAEGTVCRPPEDGEDGPEGSIPQDTWLVCGTIVSENNEPASEVEIRFFDKEHLFDDVLGTSTTGPDGSFKMAYREQDFADLFEKKPDLYLRVQDSKGNKIFENRKPVSVEAGRMAEFKIKLKSKKNK